MHPFLIFIMVIISLIVIAVAYFFFAVSKAISDASSDYEDKLKCQKKFILDELNLMLGKTEIDLQQYTPQSSICQDISGHLPHVGLTNDIKSKLKQIMTNVAKSEEKTNCDTTRRWFPQFTNTPILEKLYDFIETNINNGTGPRNGFDCGDYFGAEEHFTQILPDCYKSLPKLYDDLSDASASSKRDLTTIVKIKKLILDTKEKCKAEIAAAEAEAKAVAPVIAGVETDTLAMVPNESLEELQQELPKENFGADPFSNIENFAAF